MTLIELCPLQENRPRASALTYMRVTVMRPPLNVKKFSDQKYYSNTFQK